MMQLILAFMTATVLAFVAPNPLTPEAIGSELAPQEQKLIPEAKKEGGVTVINSSFSDIAAQRLGSAFIKRYGLGDNFKFNNLRKGTGALISQVRQEIRANRFTVDVVLVSAPAFFDEAAKRGNFLELDSGYAQEYFELLDKAGQYHNYPFVVVPFAYTFQPVWNASCPGMQDVTITSYADVVHPRFKGKTIVSDITKGITYTNSAISLKESGFDLKGFYKKLKATNPLIEFRTEPKMQMVISCERPLDYWNLGGRVYQNVLKKPELAKVLKIGHFKEGQVMLGNQASVLKGAPNPNAGKLFVEFMLSKEGTDIYVEAESLYTFRRNYTPPPAARPYLLDLSKHKLLGLKDWVGAQERVKTTREEWLSYFK